MRGVKLRGAVVLALALSAVALTAAPAQASHTTVVTISGDVTHPVFGTVHVGAHASGPASDLSGQGFDTPGKPPGRPPVPLPGYCRFALVGALAGDTVTLSGLVGFSSDPSLVGAPVTITADTSTGDITFDFAGFVFTGTGSVVVAHS